MRKISIDENASGTKKIKQQFEDRGVSPIDFMEKTMERGVQVSTDPVCPLCQQMFQPSESPEPTAIITRWETLKQQFWPTLQKMLRAAENARNVYRIRKFLYYYTNLIGQWSRLVFLAWRFAAISMKIFSFLWRLQLLPWRKSETKENVFVNFFSFLKIRKNSFQTDWKSFKRVYTIRNFEVIIVRLKVCEWNN